MDSKFHFYCFCETNLKANEPHDFNISPDFLHEHLYAIEDKRKGSGISIFYDRSISFIKDIQLCTRNAYFETLGGKLNTDFGFINVIVVYRFNNVKNLEQFHTLFDEFVQNFCDSPSIIFGDFNFNTFHFNDDYHISLYCDSLMAKAFSPLISKATHIRSSTITSIDNVWCNFVSKSTFSAVLDISVSNHLPLTVLLPTSANVFSSDESEESDIHSLIIHRVSAINVENFGDHFEKYCHNFEQHADKNITCDPNKSLKDFDNFFGDIKNIYEKTVLEKINVKNKRNFVNRPWVTMGIAKSCSIKNKLYNRWVRARGSSREQLAMAEYKSYRSKLRAIIMKSKENHFITRFKNCQGNIKKC